MAQIDRNASSALNRQNNAVYASDAIATAKWMHPDDVSELQYDPRDNLFLGAQGNLTSPDGKLIGYVDDRHLMTVAGSRAGKGTSAIIPTLLDYKGSIFVLDPKGENASITAERRGAGNENIAGMGQTVAVLDPFGKADVRNEYRKSFNPLDWLSENDTAIYEAHTIADGFVLSSSDTDTHWDESAKSLIQAIILHVKSWKHIADDERHLPHVRLLLMEGDKKAKARIVKYFETQLDSVIKSIDEAARNDENSDIEALEADLDRYQIELENAKQKSPMEYLLRDMQKNEAYGGYVSQWANSFRLIPFKERGSIESTAKRHTGFLAGSAMASVLKTSDFDLRALREDSKGFSLYLCLPAKYLATHGRWLRAMLSQTLNTFEDMGTVDPDTPRVLFVLDEFASLGYIQLLEKAAGLMAGFGVKLWFILQDLTQLKRHYKEGWETFIGNAGVVQFFGVSDKTTCDYISARLGKIELQREVITTSSGTSTSSALSTSESSNTSTGTQMGFDPTKTKDENVTGNHFIETGGSDGTSSGRSSGQTNTTGSTSSESRALNFTESNLLNADEIAALTARERNTQILLIDGMRPIFINRFDYFRSIWCRGKYDDGRNRSLADTKAATWDELKELYKHDPDQPLPEIPEYETKWQDDCQHYLAENQKSYRRFENNRAMLPLAGFVTGILSSIVLTVLFRSGGADFAIGIALGFVVYALGEAGNWLWSVFTDMPNNRARMAILRSDAYREEKAQNDRVRQIKQEVRFLKDKKYRFDHYIWKMPFFWKEGSEIQKTEKTLDVNLPDISSLTVNFGEAD